MPRTKIAPTHPGAILREDILPALGLNVSEAAAQLGVSRVAFSRVLNERAALSPELALRLEAWLGKDRGGDADHWIAMQRNCDMWHARQEIDLRGVTPALRSPDAAHA